MQRRDIHVHMLSQLVVHRLDDHGSAGRSSDI